MDFTTVKGKLPDFNKRPMIDILAVILLTGGALVVLYMLEGMEIRREIASSHIRKVTSTAAVDFMEVLRRPETGLALTAKWGAAGVFDHDDVEALNAKFRPFIEEIESISGVVIASSEGGEYFIMRDGGSWLSRTSSDEDGRRVFTWSRWISSRQLETWTEEAVYDPRERPWFRGAVDSVDIGEVFWTAPYRFLTRGQSGITGATRWISADSTIWVAAFDVLMTDLDKSLRSLSIPDSGISFVFRNDSSLFSPEDVTEEDGSAFIGKEEIGNPLIVSAINGWSEQDDGTRAFEFEQDEQVYWAGYYPLNTSRHLVWMAVIVPERSFLSEIQGERNSVIVWSAGILAAGALLGFLILMNFSKRMKRITGGHVSPEDFRTQVSGLIREGESRVLEFKSTMRMNLATGKAGKEIELAWLKSVSGFMNTDGGRILLGVNDDGEIVGIEADNFENIDKARLHFRNLIKQHIGLEFSDYVRFSLEAFDGKTVAMVSCRPSPKPVFLKTKSEESYYIRSGPSSVKLSLSDMLKYLENKR